MAAALFRLDQTWRGTWLTSFCAAQDVNGIKTPVELYDLYHVPLQNEYYEVWRAAPGVLPLYKDTWLLEDQYPDRAKIEPHWVATIYRLWVMPQK